MSVLLWLSTAPSLTWATVLKGQTFANANEPQPTTYHLPSQPCLIAIAIIAIVIYLGMCNLKDFSASKSASFVFSELERYVRSSIM